MASTMDALRLVAWQTPPEVRAAAQPEPGPGEVLVRIAGAGACHSDLHFIKDFPPGLLPWELPFTLGHENAGWVEALGAGVTGLEPGEPVAVYGPLGCGRCHRCAQGFVNYCVRGLSLPATGVGLGTDGGMAPYLVVPDARHVVPLGDLDPIQAAPLTDAGLTPYHAIKRSLPHLVPGSAVVVIGVGGLGHLAVQLVTAVSPATVIAVDTSTEALALARDVGASHTVVSRPEAAAEIRELTGGLGAELVLDVVGADSTLQLAAAVVRQGGDLTILGIAGGTLPFTFFTMPYEASVQTTYWGSLAELHEVLALAARGHLHAEVQRYSLADAATAYEDMAAGRLRGRAVIVP